ncbi:hypothetical protein P3T39_006620 [Kitasatospora sp. GP82]|nr:hypothetical protein [Kitasatospora sp. GP82]
MTTVRSVLANPRYTGHQVWNRQRTDHELIDPANTTLGTRDVMRWNSPDDWVISTSPAHPALVSETDFIAVQGIRARRDTLPERQYALAGLLRCGLCGRLMESCWSHGRAAYRCRHGHSSAAALTSDRPRNAYVREDEVLPRLPALWLRVTANRADEQVGGVASVSEVIGHLRASGVTLAYDPADRTLTTSTPSRGRTAIG